MTGPPECAVDMVVGVRRTAFVGGNGNRPHLPGATTGGDNLVHGLSDRGEHRARAVSVLGAVVGLDYGSEQAFTAIDVQRAFTDTMDWIEGKAVHAGQGAPIAPFAVYEAWSTDADEPSFQARLETHLAVPQV